MLRGRLLCSALLQGEPTFPKSLSRRQKSFGIASHGKGGRKWLSVASEHLLPAQLGFSGSVLGKLVPKYQGTGVGLIHWGQSAWKHLLCKRVERTVACWAFSSAETLSSAVKGVLRPVGVAQWQPHGAWCQLHPGVSWAGEMHLSIMILAARAGWYLQPDGSWIVWGWQPPVLLLHQPFPSFPLPHNKDPLSARVTPPQELSLFP